MFDLILSKGSDQRSLLSDTQRVWLSVTHDDTSILQKQCPVHIDQNTAVDIEKTLVGLEHADNFREGQRTGYNIAVFHFEIDRMTSGDNRDDL